MSKSLVQIKGFRELNSKLKKLGNDKDKRKEVLKILGQVANPTVKAVKSFAPVSKKPHVQKRKNQRFGSYIAPGTGKKSIGKKVMSKAKNPVLYVSPRSTKKADGWYLRQFVIPGTRKQASNPFIDKAYQLTKGGVTKAAELKVARYIQKRINALSNV